MAEPLFIDPRDHDDTELGAAVRDAHARGTRVVLLMTLGRACPVCLRELGAADNCVACGDPDYPFEAERQATRAAMDAGVTDVRVVGGTLVPVDDPDDLPM